jgi:hypothetical protein
LLSGVPLDVVPGAAGLSPSDLFAGDWLYFSSGDRYWCTNGSVAGTRQVLGVSTTSLGNFGPRNALFNQDLYFSADTDGDGNRELYACRSGMASVVPGVSGPRLSVYACGGSLYATGQRSRISSYARR